MRPVATALPISLMDLIFGAERPSRLSLSVRVRAHGVVVKRIEGRKQPRANGGGARGGQLLAADDRTEFGKTRLPSAQGKSPRLVLATVLRRGSARISCARPACKSASVRRK